MGRAGTAHSETAARAATVRALPFAGDDAALVAAVQAGNTAAVAALYDRYAPRVRRLLLCVLGADRELEDLRQDAFVAVLRSIHSLTRPERLDAWISTVTVRTARSALRGRTRRWWQRLWDRGEERDVEACHASPEVGEAVRCTYEALDGLPADERVAFTLRFVEGLGLDEVAAVCGVSRATVKRRLARAERTFLTRARGHAVLQEWIEGGTRWSHGDPGD